MTKKVKLSLFLLAGAVVAIAAIAIFSRCTCEPAEVPTVEAPPVSEPANEGDAPLARTDDTAYFSRLEESRTRYLAESASRRQIVAEMEGLIVEARAALGEGATDDDVKAELEGHPEKYPRWKELWDANLAAVERLEARQRESFAVLGSRMRQEVEDFKKEGGQK